LAGIHDQILILSARLWAISPQTVDNNRTLVKRRSLPFPVLADPEQLVIKEWGVFNDDDPLGRPIPHPATYIINRDAQIHWAYIGKSTRDRPDSDEILKQLNQL
jgi:peroxiredoxin